MSEEKDNLSEIPTSALFSSMMEEEEQDRIKSREDLIEHSPGDYAEIQRAMQQSQIEAQNQMIQNAADAAQGVADQVGANPQVQQLIQSYGGAPPQEEQEADPNIFTETGAAIVGGGADAIESVGGFAELAGDTIKTGVNSLFGRPIDETQNPFSSEYLSGDAGWLDIPDHLVPENKTALGKLARGLVEFGLLTAATGGVGGATFGGARAGIRVAAAARAAGVGAKGTRYIRFIGKAGTVAAEGGVADLISTSSEDANLMNLVDDTTPWMSPWVKNVIGVNALKVNPEDNPWLSRIKTVASGAGVNLVGWGISAYAKGKYSAIDARKQGKSIDEANDIGNAKMAEELQLELELDEKAGIEKAADQWSQGNGISHADHRDQYLRKYLSKEEYEELVSPSAVDDVYASSRKAELEDIADGRGQAANDIFDFKEGKSTEQFAAENGRTADPWVNPKHFNDSEKAITRPSSKKPGLQALKESIIDMDGGGRGQSSSPIVTDAALKKMSRGDASIRQYILEVAEDLAEKSFKDPDLNLKYADVKALIIKQASDMHEALARGGNQAETLKNFLRDSDDRLLFSIDGNEIVVGTSAQRGALQLVINTLARQAQAISTGAVHQASNIPITRQVEQVFDAMKVALTEHKKIGYIIGSELADFKGFVLGPAKQARINRKLALITKEQDEYFEALHKLNREGNFQQMKDLMEINALSDGNVRALDQIHSYLQAKLIGGDMGAGAIKGKIRTELQSVFYNSILSSLKTPIDAVTSTVMIGASRPMMQYVGAALKLDRKEMAIASAGIDAISRSWAESIDMARHNWNLGLERKSQSYHGRYDLAQDMVEWKGHRRFYEQYGSEVQKRAFGALDKVVDMNSSPWMKYSANAMGAGDAFTRTMLGRVQMRMAGAREAIERGVDPTNVKEFSLKYEQNFRDKIFKLDKDDKYIVSDLATKLAGDEATMTKALEGWPKMFEEIQKVPFLRAFFPFVRTGVNAVDLTFQSSPLGFLHKKYRDLSNGIHLDKYGLDEVSVKSELAMMEGRMAVGGAITGLAFMATASGNMTGDYPYDKVGRDLWKATGKQPYSIKIGNAWVSYKELEPWNTIFSVASNMVTNADILGESAIDNWGQKLSFMASAVLVDKSMLSGVKDLTTLFSGRGAENQFGRTFSKYTRSHLPYAGLLGQIGTMMDSNAIEAQTFMELVAQRDLYWKSKLPPKYDILNKDRSGKPLNHAAESPIFRMFNAFSPIAVVPINDDPVKQTLVDMQFNLPDMVQTYEGEVLNSAQRSALSKYMSMGPLYRDLQKIFKNRNWQASFQKYKDGNYRESQGNKLSEQLFYQQVYFAFKRAKALAWNQMLRENPQLAKSIQLRKQQRHDAGRGKISTIDELTKFGY